MNILRILRTCIILLSIVYLTSYNIALGLTSLLIYICLQGNHGIDGFRNSLIDLRMGEQSIETPYTVGKQKKDKDKDKDKDKNINDVEILTIRETIIPKNSKTLPVPPRQNNYDDVQGHEKNSRFMNGFSGF